jgi:hypothetical protein
VQSTSRSGSREKKTSCLFLLGRLSGLDLLGSSDLLRSVLPLLSELSGSLLDLGGESGSDESVSGLESLLLGLGVVAERGERQQRKRRVSASLEQGMKDRQRSSRRMPPRCRRGRRGVHQSESGGSSSSEVGLEAERNDLLGVGLVHGSELLGELSSGDVGPVGVENVKDLVR